MNQEWLIKNVLKNLDSVPDTPSDEREYLSLEVSQRIVDDTIDYLGLHASEDQGDTEYTYICGHRKRLAHSLSMIPKAQGKGESCLDVGSYGYMLLWVKEHLGYDHVEGIEWHPDIPDKVIHRTLTQGDESIEIRSHNFDISKPKWAITGTYDTILFFEVLEHINTDPMGVMKRIHEHLKPDATLVMSVPNAISYKAFKEFLVGMPPWTYWFYQPDLSHEPRHCFEYTPIIFKALIKAGGLRENAFRTIYAYTEQSHEEETLQVARSFGIKDESFGETMIINATKVSSKINLRYPDVLYSPEGYYKTVYPHLHDRLENAIRHFHESNTKEEPGSPELQETIVEPKPAPETTKKLEGEIKLLKDQLAELFYTCDVQLQGNEVFHGQIESLESSAAQAVLELEQSQEWAIELQRQKRELESRINELLFTCDSYMRKEGDIEASAAALKAEHDALVQTIDHARDAALSKAQDATDRAHTLEITAGEQRQRINELLFTLDCSMRKESDLEASNQAFKAEQEQLVSAAESARDAALANTEESQIWGEALAKENADLRGQVNELLFACDCYLQQINDPTRCVQVIRERRFRSALRSSKSIARKTPILRTALRPVYRSTKKFIKRRM